MEGRTNGLGEIIKKNDRKELENMMKKESERETETERERESALNDHFSSLEAVIWLASGLQVM